MARPSPLRESYHIFLFFIRHRPACPGDSIFFIRKKEDGLPGQAGQ
jgi:hypothetical protein